MTRMAIGLSACLAILTDLGSFSGLRQGDAKYESLVTRTQEAVLNAKRYVGGPQAWMDRKGYSFFQGPGEAALIRCGSRVSLNVRPTGCPGGPVAQIEGAEPR